MLNILDNLNSNNNLDESNLAGSIIELPLQIEQAWTDISKLKIDKKYKKIKNIVINGMGGSALGGHIIKTLYKNEIKTPLEIANSYTLPAYVNQDTLVIISSYSGGTEESIASLKMVLRRKAKILGITSGGELQKICEKNNIPFYLINPIHNPSKQPRMALGYSIIGQIGLLSKCNIIKTTSAEIDSVVKHLKRLNRQWLPESASGENLAKKIALDLHSKIPILVASEFLEGSVHAMANQINENAKTFTPYFFIPELNHHLMEGLAFPAANKQLLKFFFIKSSFYHRRNQKRCAITEQVIKKNNIDFIEYQAIGKNKLEQTFEILLLGSYLGFYLAMLNKINPAPVPWVDYFKEELKK